MVSLTQMTKYTPAKIKKKTLKTVKSVRLVKAVIDSDEYGVHKRANFRVKATTDSRKVIVKIYEEGKGVRRKKVSILERPAWVHCSCEWFTFYCEVALASRNSSSVINSNGNAPVETNPRQWPYICKHILAVLDRLKNIKFKMPKVKPTENELQFLMDEIEKYIPGR